MATRKIKKAPQRTRRGGTRPRRSGGSNGVMVAGLAVGLVIFIGLGWAVFGRSGTENAAGPVANPGTRAARPAEPAGAAVPAPRPGTGGATTPPTASPGAAAGEENGGADEAAIRGLFGKYRSAAIACRGEEAVEYVDQNTLDYFQKMVDLARTGSAAEVHQQTFVNRMMILLCRAQYEPKDLKDMTGRMLFISGVDRGQTGKQGMTNLEPGKVIIEGEVAVVQMKSQSDRSTVSMTYRRENGVWKMDMTEMLKVADMAMKAAVQQQGLDEDEFLMSALESVLGHKLREDIWEPVFPKD